MEQYEYELIQKTKEYKQYIENHIANVKTAWRIIDKATDKYNAWEWKKHNDGQACIIIDDLIRDHDKSKWSVEEFGPYRKKFFPVIGEESQPKEFEKAWKHHQDCNLHHWQSMQAIGYKDLIILEYTIEMICDWFAMAIHFGEHHRDYYNKHKEKIELQDWQHELIETIYTALDMWFENKDSL